MEIVQANHDIASLEKQLKNLDKLFAQIIELNPVPKIIIDIHGPGWTTPAEFALFKSLLANTIALTKQLHENQRFLSAGSSAILKR